MKPRVKPALRKATRVERCGFSGKRRYRTAAAAELALDATRTVARDPNHPDARRRRERRIHSCVQCGGWHLTSQP